MKRSIFFAWISERKLTRCERDLPSRSTAHTITTSNSLRMAPFHVVFEHFDVLIELRELSPTKKFIQGRSPGKHVHGSFNNAR